MLLKTNLQTFTKTRVDTPVHLPSVNQINGSYFLSQALNCFSIFSLNHPAGTACNDFLTKVQLVFVNTTGF